MENDKVFNRISWFCMFMYALVSVGDISQGKYSSVLLNTMLLFILGFYLITDFKDRVILGV